MTHPRSEAGRQAGTRAQPPPTFLLHWHGESSCSQSPLPPNAAKAPYPQVKSSGSAGCRLPTPGVAYFPFWKSEEWQDGIPDFAPGRWSFRLWPRSSNRFEDLGHNTHFSTQIAKCLKQAFKAKEQHWKEHVNLLYSLGTVQAAALGSRSQALAASLYCERSLPAYMSLIYLPKALRRLPADYRFA